jgi:hypothetical protein
LKRTCLLTVAALALFVSALPARTADRIVRERIEWCDIWIPSADDSKLPRVLLIGDSITRGYYPRVEQGLSGKALVARLTTSKSLGDPALLAEVELVVKQYPWDVIHFNNGMHGWGYTEQEYGASFPKLIAQLRKDAPKAKLIWANTTPVRVSGKLEQIEARTERVKHLRGSGGEGEDPGRRSLQPAGEPAGVLQPGRRALERGGHRSRRRSGGGEYHSAPTGPIARRQ